MKESEKKPTDLLHTGDKIRKILLEHPDLPLLVFAGDECNSGDYSYMSCTLVTAEVGEFLDCQQDVEPERCYNDRGDFEEALADRLYYSDEAKGKTDEEFDALVKEKMAEYDPYWKPCIILWVNN